VKGEQMLERLSQKDELLAQMRRRLDAAVEENERLRVALAQIQDAIIQTGGKYRSEKDRAAAVYKIARAALAGAAEPQAARKERV
jgi:predicted phage gp36 major capsid-like protein